MSIYTLHFLPSPTDEEILDCL